MNSKIKIILKEENLEHLLPAFEEQGVTDSILEDLTDDDLRSEFRVTKLGERKRLLAAFSRSSASPAGGEAAPEATSAGELVTRSAHSTADATAPENTSVEDDPSSEFVGIAGGSLPASSSRPSAPVGDFFIGRFLVTVELWRFVRYWAVVRGYDIPGGEGAGMEYPVTDITWLDCLKWCNARSEMESLPPAYLTWGGEVFRKGTPSDLEGLKCVPGEGYRLPFTHEWEWAARGGQKSKNFVFAGSNNLLEVAWMADNSGESAHPVGGKKPNELGIYDMSGNVWECCWDDLDYHSPCVIRGGCYSSDAAQCAVEAPPKVVHWDLDIYTESIYGFRVARGDQGNFTAWRGHPSAAVDKKSVMEFQETLRRNEQAMPLVYVEPQPWPASDSKVAITSPFWIFGRGFEDFLRPFAIGKYPVTFKLWQRVCKWAQSNGYEIANGQNGSNSNGKAIEDGGRMSHPVTMVNWYDCVKWCNALSEMEGLSPVYYHQEAVYRSGEPDASEVQQVVEFDGYRLPLEAEWEWAARGGVKSQGYIYAGSNDLKAVGWYSDNSGEHTHPVGEKAGNELELYDMSGNVDEWCWDAYSESDGRRVLRGGSWKRFFLPKPKHCAVAVRDCCTPGFRFDFFGFRFARRLGS